MGAVLSQTQQTAQGATLQYATTYICITTCMEKYMLFRFVCAIVVTIVYRDDMETRKRRRLCSHFNQRLAKTTYWEHQKRFFGGHSSSGSESNFSIECDIESECEVDAEIVERDNIEHFEEAAKSKAKLRS